MFIYICLFAAALIFGVFLNSKKFEPWGKPLYCAGFGITFILVSALRFSTGYDYNMYATIYHNYSFVSLEEIGQARLEKGFAIPLAVLNQYSDTYLPMFVLTSIVICLGVFILIYKYSSVPWVSVITFLSLGMFFNSLNFLRQFTAAIIVTFALQYIEKKNPFKFLTVVIIASIFHWSALIMIPFYLLLQIKPGIILSSVSAVVLVFIYLFSNPVMEFLTQTFYMYKGYDPEKSVEMINGLPIKYTVMFLVPFIICMIFKNRLMERNKVNRIYINCLLFIVFFEVIGTKHAIISRFALLFFLPVMMALIPDLYITVKEYISERFSKIKLPAGITAGVLGLAAAVSCYIMLMSSNYNGVMPYQSIINKSTNEYYREQQPSVTEAVTEPAIIDNGNAEPSDEEIDIEDYYVDWENFDWNEENWVD